MSPKPAPDSNDSSEPSLAGTPRIVGNRIATIEDARDIGRALSGTTVEKGYMGGGGGKRVGERGGVRSAVPSSCLFGLRESIGIDAARARGIVSVAASG